MAQFTSFQPVKTPFGTATASREPCQCSQDADLQRLAKYVAQLIMQDLSHISRQQNIRRWQVDDHLLFVISAFTAELDPAYCAIAAAAEAVGMRAERVKDVRGDYRITDKILTMIRSARLIVTDLTHDRPNVYFELSYARALGKTVITVLRSGTKPHFDVYDWTYLEYVDSRPLQEDLLERLRYELQEPALAQP